MPRNLIYFSDGTWQSPDSPNQSNVFKLFNALAGANTLGAPTDLEQERQSPPAEGAIEHIAKYIDGVGADGNWLEQQIGGSIGVGLITHVLRGYTFLSRNYQEGDRLFLVGFSRGSYTVRALAGLIATKGLLAWQALGLSQGATDQSGYQLAAKAWSDYIIARQQTNGTANALGRIESILADVPTVFVGLLDRPIFNAKTDIAAIGVFDTVGALGIPEMDNNLDARIDVLRFVDTSLSDEVAEAFHAVAIDEQRIDFTPTLWDAREGITQVLFPGAHADVGGGYPLNDQSRLSDAALEWMAQNLQDLGINVTVPPAPADAALGPQHEPWKSSVWTARPVGPRLFPPLGAQLALSGTALTRLTQEVTVIPGTTTPQPRQVPYVPASMVESGHLNLAGVRPV